MLGLEWLIETIGNGLKQMFPALAMLKHVGNIFGHVQKARTFV